MFRFSRSCGLVASVGLAAAISAAIPAAAMVVLFSDGNSMAAPTPPRNALLSNVLGSGESVLVSSRVIGFPDASVFSTYYDGLSGVSATYSETTVQAADLSGVDLLFLNFGCCLGSQVDYTEVETALFVAFEAAGGTLAILAEPCCSGDRAGVNAFLAALGTDLSLEAHDTRAGAAMLADNPLTAGAEGYSLNTFNPIVGGTALASLNGNVAIAVSGSAASPVPAPAALPLLAGALGLFGLVARRRRG